MTEIPLAPLERILRRAGAQRVSEDAVVTLSKILQDAAEEMSEDIIENAKKSGRDIIQPEDVKAAIKK